jgi:hypothetical protein
MHLDRNNNFRKVSLLLLSAIVLSLSSCNSSCGTSEVSNTTSNTNSTNSNVLVTTNVENTNYSANTTKGVNIMPNTPVMRDLEIAIDRWSNAEAGSYGLGTTLISLWRPAFPTIEYNPVGIDRLIGRIKKQQTFMTCQRAGKLNRNMFHDEGINTVGKLYDYLEPCNNA